jgi:hypothetical protein
VSTDEWLVVTLQRLERQNAEILDLLRTLSRRAAGKGVEPEPLPRPRRTEDGTGWETWQGGGSGWLRWEGPGRPPGASPPEWLEGHRAEGGKKPPGTSG